jgi:arsenite-transporting ATPase
MRGEVEQLQRVEQGLAQRVFLLPWQGEPPVGVPALRALVS